MAVESGQADAASPTAGKRDPSYEVLCKVEIADLKKFVLALRGDEDEGYRAPLVVLVDSRVKATSRDKAIEWTRELLPEEAGFGDWVAVLSQHFEWQVVEDPYAKALDELVPAMMEVNPGADEGDVRARARAALKRADQS